MQIGAGLFFVILIFLLAFNSTPYISAWEEEDSSFYETAVQALRVRTLHPAAPTAIVFWSRKNDDSLKSARAFGSLPAKLRVYGVHVGDDREIDVRKAWLRVAPRTAPLIFDRTEILKTSFHVKSLPMAYIILPKQKKIYSYWGDVADSKEQILGIIDSE